MTTPLNGPVWTKVLVSEDGTAAQAYYKGELLIIPLRFNFWQWCECELAELQRSRTVLAAIPEGMEEKLTAEEMEFEDEVPIPHEAELLQKLVMDEMEVRFEKLVTAEVEAFEAATGSRNAQLRPELPTGSGGLDEAVRP